MSNSQTEKHTQTLRTKRVSLPIDAHLHDITQAVQDFSQVILIAEPGAGKTTRVPPALLPLGKWIVLQPRRWAAKLTSQRIAEENEWKLGEEVGYQIRFENKTSKNSRLIVMTEGVLIRKLIEDPELSGFRGVILDEFHERSLDADLALALLKEIQESFRADLKIVVMSATLDPVPLEKFLGNSKTFQISGRTFPVVKKYLGRVSVLSAVKTALSQMEENLETEEGDVLVFLPGAFEIQKAVREIEAFLPQIGLHKNTEVLPLYSSLPDREQKRVFEMTMTAQGKRKRKIIVATNIAETSLTLPFIKVVIDQGTAKVMRLDPQLGMNRLETLSTSRASSEQRAGRAGRVSAGICYRLWTEGEQTQLRHFETPEIHRVSLSDALLSLGEFGVRDFQSFHWFEKPKSSMLDFSVQELVQLQFLKEGRITEMGRHALRLPLSPALAKLVLESYQMQVPAFGVRLAAFLENQNTTFQISSEEDFIKALNSLSGLAQRSAEQIMKSLLHLKKQTFHDSTLLPLLNPEACSSFESVMIRAFPNKVFMNGLMVGRRKVVTKDASTVLPKEGFALNSIERVSQGVTQVVIQSWVPLASEVLQKEAQKKKNVFWDEEGKRVRTLEGVFFQDLEMGNVSEVATSPQAAQSILMNYLLKKPAEILSANESFRRWIKRVEFYEKNRGEGDAPISLHWQEWIEAACSGQTRLEGVLQFPFQSFIEGLMSRELLKQWNEWVPDAIEVPSLCRHELNYEGTLPKLSVRLQEVFGWVETPKIMGGRIPILIELLSPSFKPIQVTQDLRSFWKQAYFEVKKELKARYPKHAWPEDPLTAKAEAKGRRRFI